MARRIGYISNDPGPEFFVGSNLTQPSGISYF